VGVTFLNRQETIQFASASDTSVVSSWTSSPTNPRLKVRSLNLNDSRSKTFNLAAGGYQEFYFFLACPANNVANNSACSSTSEDVVALFPALPTSEGALNSTVQVEVNVSKDEGALVADYNTQDLVVYSSQVVNTQTSRSLNGGRPF
jgi:hypothetical protein